MGSFKTPTFRAKIKENGEYIEGSLIIDCDGVAFINNDGVVLTIGNKSKDYELVLHEVKKDTISMYFKNEDEK